MSGIFVVREIHGEGDNTTQQVCALQDDGWTLMEFQLWFLGIYDAGRFQHTGSERNEILAYYPEGLPEGMGDDVLASYDHPMWKDPDGWPAHD